MRSPIRASLRGGVLALLLLPLLWPTALAAALVDLQGPLATTVVAPGRGPVGGLEADVVVPADAPADLGMAYWVADHDGHWFELPGAQGLAPGVHHVRAAFSPRSQLQAIPAGPHWDAVAAATCDRCGLVFSTTHRSSCHLEVQALVRLPSFGLVPSDGRLTDLQLLPAPRQGVCQVACGTRWEAHLRADPWPADPDDPAQVALDATITGPAGQQWVVPGFCEEPQAAQDRGDRLIVQPAGARMLVVRFRPCVPGRYEVRLRVRWARGPAHEVVLPPLEAAGPAVRPYAEIDATDGRFFSVDGRLWWPIGLNCHSPFDLRSRGALGTRLTPDRGALVYDALLPRFAAAGGDCCEIWMASWNVGLEWRADWPGYGGIGRINQAHAWALDHILDRALALGMRVNLVINNHGQASAGADREWRDNPWNRERGGPLDQPAALFTDPRALAGQELIRRAIIARWADHPAILGWKLWSEVDLTAARGEIAWQWHEQAAARWHALDAYHHPVTTHWAGDFRRVNPLVAELPGIDYLCIDAYRQGSANGGWRLLGDILADSAYAPNTGLSMYGKPILTSEYGAGAGASPTACRLVDHLTGAWAALVSGHAGSPMLWWWEWVDQGDRWAPYAAIRAFLRDEDLRHGRPAALICEPEDRVWARAWVKPGHVLAYLLDRAWGSTGDPATPIDDARLELGTHIAPGQLRLTWWDADRGSVVADQTITHAGGVLRVMVPAFRRHCALKVQRLTGTPARFALDAALTAGAAP